MGWDVAGCWNSDLEISKANHPEIRLITISTPGTQETLETCDDEWQACTPESVRSFSGVGYFFGLELHEQLGVPIGLIDNAWGGSACEAWIPLDRMEGNPMYAALLERWKKTAQEFDLEAAKAQLVKDMKSWEEKKAAGHEWARRPYLKNPLVGQHRPANLYHGRLGPVKPFGIRGVIWYQGETNAGRGYQYREMFPLMIRTWREVWGQGDFPFYWVQLADFLREVEEPQESNWAETREAQTLTLDREPHTGEAVIIDLGEGKDIHPREKHEVARRLARHALANEYGFEIDHTSPRYKSMVVLEPEENEQPKEPKENEESEEREENEEDLQAKIVITLQGEGKGIRTFDTHAVQGFAIAGEDRQWHNAQAKIVGERSVEVWSDKVPAPIAVRYAWADNPVCNLMTWSGLPVTPFRTDDWPGKTTDAR